MYVCDTHMASADRNDMRVQVHGGVGGSGRGEGSGEEVEGSVSEGRGRGSVIGVTGGCR